MLVQSLTIAQKARKKLGQKAGVDYLKYLAEQGREDTFLDLVSFVKERYKIAQRLGIDFAKASKRSVAFTDAYQAEVSESEKHTSLPRYRISDSDKHSCSLK